MKHYLVLIVLTFCICTLNAKIVTEKRYVWRCEDSYHIVTMEYESTYLVIETYNKGVVGSSKALIPIELFPQVIEGFGEIQQKIKEDEQ